MARFLNPSLSSRTTKRWLLRTVGALALIVASGYLSNALARRTCEIKTAKWLIGPGNTTNYLWSDDEADSAAIFQAAGLTVLPHPHAQRVFPVFRVSRAHFVAPFILEVEYGRVYAPLAGDGGTIRYFSFFGHVIRLREQMEWVS